MSIKKTLTEEVKTEYKVNPVREDGKVVALEVARWITTTQLGTTGYRKRGTNPEYTFEDEALIDIKDVSDLVGSLTGALYGALSDLERGLV